MEGRKEGKDEWMDGRMIDGRKDELVGECQIDNEYMHHQCTLFIYF